uniref:Uncharacterized protein n=1 Tax=viral metagenome TaxID=1070528 RepID=A0A6C0C4Q7_9ZZZZ
MGGIDTVMLEYSINFIEEHLKNIKPPETTGKELDRGVNKINELITKIINLIVDLIWMVFEKKNANQDGTYYNIVLISIIIIFISFSIIRIYGSQLWLLLEGLKPGYYTTDISDLGISDTGAALDRIFKNLKWWVVGSIITSLQIIINLLQFDFDKISYDFGSKWTNPTLRGGCEKFISKHGFAGDFTLKIDETLENYKNTGGDDDIMGDNYNNSNFPIPSSILEDSKRPYRYYDSSDYLEGRECTNRSNSFNIDKCLDKSTYLCSNGMDCLETAQTWPFEGLNGNITKYLGLINGINTTSAPRKYNVCYATNKYRDLIYPNQTNEEPIKVQQARRSIRKNIFNNNCQDIDPNTILYEMNIDKTFNNNNKTYIKANNPWREGEIPKNENNSIDINVNINSTETNEIENMCNNIIGELGDCSRRNLTPEQQEECFGPFKLLNNNLKGQIFYIIENISYFITPPLLFIFIIYTIYIILICITLFTREGRTKYYELKDKLIDTPKIIKIFNLIFIIYMILYIIYFIYGHLNKDCGEDNPDNCNKCVDCMKIPNHSWDYKDLDENNPYVCLPTEDFVSIDPNYRNRESRILNRSMCPDTDFIAPTLTPVSYTIPENNEDDSSPVVDFFLSFLPD